MTTTYPHWIFDGSPIDDPALFTLKSGEVVGGGERAVRFLRSLRHPKSSLPRRAFQLDPYQERIVRGIYGPRYLADVFDANGNKLHSRGDRIVKTVVLLLPRGNRKTSLSAALALLHTIGPERVPGGEAIFAASDRTQGNIGFREAASIIEEDRRLVAATRVYNAQNAVKRVVFKGDGAFLEVVSSDGRRQHGRTPNFVLADELHSWPKDDLMEALETGLGKTNNGLLVIATTAGRGQNTLAWRKIEEARQVARGEREDPTMLPILFEADKDEDWTDEAVWFRTNPGLAHGYPSLGEFHAHAKRAVNSIADRESFRLLKLNTWLDASLSPFVDMSVYDKGGAPISDDVFERLRNEDCYVALDASIASDLTAVVAAWRDPDDPEGFIVLPHFFCPENELRKKEVADRAPYVAWAEAGLITPTPGDVIDYRIVAEHIAGLHERFFVAETVFDRAYAMSIIVELQKMGFPAFGMPLDVKSQAAGVSVLERAICARKLRHGGNPILRWNLENVSIYEGPSGLRTMHKGKSRARIDGAFAAWMAVSRAAFNQPAPNPMADPNYDAAAEFA